MWLGRLTRPIKNTKVLCDSEQHGNKQPKLVIYVRRRSALAIQPAINKVGSPGAWE